MTWIDGYDAVLNEVCHLWLLIQPPDALGQIVAAALSKYWPHEPSELAFQRLVAWGFGRLPAGLGAAACHPSALARGHNHFGVGLGRKSSLVIGVNFDLHSIGQGQQIGVEQTGRQHLART